MNKIETEKLLLAFAENKDVCVSIEEFIDIIKDRVFDKTEPRWNDFQETTEREILHQGLYGKYGETNIHCSAIVGAGHIRVAKVPNPTATLSKLRQSGDENVKRLIEENWSDEIPLAKYGEQ